MPCTPFPLRRSAPPARPARAGVVAAMVAIGAACGVPGSGGASAQEITLGATPHAETITRPALAGRIVRSFTFEERESNPLPVPQFWFRAQHDPASRSRPGFPSWNASELDYEVASSGVGSVRVPARGGSGSLRLEPGVIPVFPGADYTVSADVRTLGAANARARITARFLDAAGEPIAGSERHTEPVQTDGGWRAERLLIRGLAGAAFLQVDLEMLQAREFLRVPLPAFQVWPEDFDARAWFDNVSVLQMPRIELATVQGVNVLGSKDRPVLIARTRDLTGQTLTARFVVRDLAGRVLDTHVSPVERGPAGLRWTPNLPRLGWYHARLELFADGLFVGGSELPLAWLERGERRAADATRFVMLFDQTDPEELARIPAYADALGIGRVVVPAWTSDLTIENRDDWFETLFGVIEDLIERRIEVAVGLDRVPLQLAAKTGVDPRDPITLLSAHAAQVDPYLLRLLDRYGQSVQRWLLGSPTLGPVMSSDDLSQHLAQIDAMVGRFVPGPIIGIPWKAELGLPGRLRKAPPDATSVMIPPSFARGGLAEWLRAFADALREREQPAREPHELTLLLQSIDPTLHTQDACLNDLVLRGVEAWTMIEPLREADIHLSIGMVDPWTATDVRSGELAPTPQAVALAALSDHLSERRFIAALPTPPGIHAYLFEGMPGTSRPRSDMMVVWTDRPEATLDLYLGPEAVEVVDLFGNRNQLEPTGESEADAIRTHKIALTPAPLFVEGVDADLVTMASSFRVDPPFLVSNNEMQERALVLHNPFAVPILVRYFLVEPGTTDEGRRDRAWSIVPRTGTVQIEPGTDGRIPITVIPSAMEESGLKSFVLDAQVSADKSYGWMRLRSDVQLGLEHIRVDLGMTPSPTRAGPDVVLDVHITNTGSQPATLEVVAVAPGLPRQRSSVTDLPPGTPAVRRFVFSGAAASLKNQRIYVGVTDTATGGRLNVATSLPSQ